VQYYTAALRLTRVSQVWLIRRLLLPFSLFLLVLVLLNCQQPPASTSLKEVLKHEIAAVKKELPAYRLTVGAHRGSSVKHRENTLPALRAAEADARYAFIEFDVQYTGDKQIVLFHDRRLFRLFKKSDALGNTSYADLLQLTGGEIILYQEAMAVLGKKINLEIKSQGNEQDDQRLADAVIADLKKRGRENDVMVSSISSEVIHYISTNYPDIQTGQIFWLTWSTYLHFEALTEGLFDRFKATDADYLLLHVANLRNIEDLLKLKPLGKTVMFWDFDDRMYVVHKDLGDRLWGTSVMSEIWRRLCFNLAELVR
jgi:glycerophosphoryl diester phosphodiesterase